MTLGNQIGEFVLTDSGRAYNVLNSPSQSSRRETGDCFLVKLLYPRSSSIFEQRLYIRFWEENNEAQSQIRKIKDTIMNSLRNPLLPHGMLVAELLSVPLRQTSPSKPVMWNAVP